MKYFREDLHRRLLSTDFKKQVDGIEMLQKVLLLLNQSNCGINYHQPYFFCTFQALPSIGKELIEVLDVVLRWFVLRFCESNTSCILKVCSYSFYLSFSLMLSCYFSSAAFFHEVISVRTVIIFHRFWNFCLNFLRC